MPKYEFDAERWLRNVAEVQSHRAGAGPAMLRETMLKCADEIHRLRMADDLNQQGAEHMREEMAKVKAELSALKEAANGLLAIHRRHKDLTVYSDQDYKDIWSERVDALAALAGEE